jgi:hypothetical protein
MKKLSEISWLVTEEVYRADPALSQSTLTKFEKTGFEGLDKLFEAIDTPSLRFGSMVDCLITDGEKAFQDQYIVSDIPSMEPAIKPIVEEVFKLYKNSYTNINDIPDSCLMPIISQAEYQQRWKPETRCKVVREKGQQYYQTMFMAGDKKIVTQDVYNKVFACVWALKNSPQTHDYFCEDNPFDNIERYYQLKFKDTFDGVPYRGMADLLIVNHEKKVVYPCDLKTSGHREYDFYKSFVQWQYQCQARLYWRLIRSAMDKDDYYKDFKLEDFRFIVVNNIDNPNPLVWLFDKTKAVGELTYGDIVMRDPEVIGKELYHYLQDKPSVPEGIKVKGMNNISEWLNKCHARDL